MSLDYYSIEDILTTQELIPCTILQNIPKLGVLNPSSDSEDLVEGTELELPLWLVQFATIGRQAILKVDLPIVYKERHRGILKADPCVIDLPKFNLHYYELGRYLSRFDPQSDEILACLETTFQTRFCQLVDLCENISINPSNVEKFDLLEQRIFLDCHKARMKLHKWLTASKTKIEASNLIENQKKRLRIDSQILD